MKSSLTKLFMIDERSLIQHSKKAGIIVMIISVLFAIFLGQALSPSNEFGKLEKERIHSATVSLLDTSTINEESGNWKTLVHYANCYPSFIESTFKIFRIIGYLNVICWFGIGMLLYRYGQVLQKLNSNQRLEPTSLNAGFNKPS